MIYLSHTRLDIAFAVSMMSQFMHSFGHIHFEVVNGILRYLKETLGNGILFQKHDHFQAKCILMQMELEVLLIEDLLPATICLLEEI